MTRKPAKREKTQEEERRPGASPVCYLDDPAIDPAYLWANPDRKRPPRREGGAGQPRREEDGDEAAAVDRSSPRLSPRSRGAGGLRRRR